MRKTFIKMGLNLADMTLVHDTFDGIIPGQSSTALGASIWKYLVVREKISARRC
jgi:hypothetical protein